MLQLEREPAYILHVRAYQDTSLLLDCFTQEQGRLSLLAKGAKRGKSPTAHILQPFLPLVLTARGKGELLVLTQVDVGASHRLPFALFPRAFYLNELLYKLLHRHDPMPALFDAYEHAILKGLTESALRCFEKRLLTELGYGLTLTEEYLTAASVQESSYYRFDCSSGLVLVSPSLKSDVDVFSGEDLIGIAQEIWENKATLKAAKRLFRLAIQSLLGSYEIKSRDLIWSKA